MQKVRLLPFLRGNSVCDVFEKPFLLKIHTIYANNMDARYLYSGENAMINYGITGGILRGVLNEIFW